MGIVLHDLAGDGDRRFSPYCWRIRMALAHKGLDYDTAPVTFSDIPGIGGGDHKTVPVLEDDGTFISESFDIACYLEEQYESRGTLFGGEGGKAACRFIESWANATLTPIIARACVKDIHDLIEEKDKPYFRETREKRLGGGLEDLQSQRDAHIENLHQALMPLHVMLGKQDWIGGIQPLYHDYIVFGTLQWPRVTSKVPLLKEDSRVAEWFERMLNLYDRLGAKMPARAA
ncbi:glutathione S-transferase family protein [Tepidamorphus sp. 3E244]|uniref:glutathione S-transferase family protein n=1 Tax=Tepidamorphus sp. 3E244 TaxID=3385498 RepID=UPI0038FC7EB4